SDILKLVKTINKACGDEKLKEDRLDKAFDVWYPKLEEELSKIEKPIVDEQTTKPIENRNTEILEEILELSRSNQRILTSPDLILPPDYLDFAISRGRSSERNLDFIKEQTMVLRDLEHSILRL